LFIYVTKNHFDIDCLYHRQGNEQKQVAIYSSIQNLKSPSIRTPSLLKKKVKSVIYLLFSYQTRYIMWHSLLTMYIPFGCTSGNIDPKLGMSRIIPLIQWSVMLCRPCFNRFGGLKYIPRLFSEYMLTFSVEETMKICVTNYDTTPRPQRPC
jgi:hypothetical protein